MSSTVASYVSRDASCASTLPDSLLKATSSRWMSPSERRPCWSFALAPSVAIMIAKVCIAAASSAKLSMSRTFHSASRYLYSSVPSLIPKILAT